MERVIHFCRKKFIVSRVLFVAVFFSLGCAPMRAAADDDEPPFEEPGTTRKPIQSIVSPRHREVDYLLTTNQNFELKPDKTNLLVTPFYNKASRMGYLADHLDQTVILDFLKEITHPEDLDSLSAILDKAIPIIERFTTQERKVGAMLQFGFPFKKWTLGLQVPVLASIRNLWVPVPDQTALRKIFADLPSNGPLKPSEIEAKLSETPFRVGLGDTRLKFSFIPIDSQLVTTQLGATLIVPTSRICNPAIRTQTAEEAALRFKDIIDAVTGLSADDNFKKVFFQVVKTLQGISLRPSLGVGHWGAGIFAHSRIPLFEDCFDFWHKASFDYFLPGKEFRYIIAAGRHTMPQEKKVILSPGSVIHSVFGGDYKFSSSWKLGLFYDWYYQCEEHIRKTAIQREDLPFYDISDIEKPRAMQQKVGLNLTYYAHDWDMLIGGERVVDHGGIGRGWSVFSEISCSF